MLRYRILSSATAIPVLVLIIWFNGPWYTLLVAIAALLGLAEFYAMANVARPVAVVGMAFALSLILNAHFYSSYGSDTTPWITTIGLVALAAIVLSFAGALGWSQQRNGVVGVWSWSLAGVLYMGWLLSFWILIMDSHFREWVFLALFSTFAVDTSAYFVGRAYGRRKLAPVISPAKTWEGAVGGLAGGVAVAIVLALIMGIDVAIWKVAVLGSLVGTFSQLGDLTESKLKRTAGVKEAGSLIPGHGGILDRLDSVVFVGVVVYYFLELFV